MKTFILNKVISKFIPVHWKLCALKHAYVYVYIRYAKLETKSALREISDAFDSFPHSCCILLVFHDKMLEQYNSVRFILSPILFNLINGVSIP